MVDGYTWTRIPGTGIEVRARVTTPLALRYRPRGIAAAGKCCGTLGYVSGRRSGTAATVLVRMAQRRCIVSATCLIRHDSGL